MTENNEVCRQHRNDNRPDEYYVFSITTNVSFKQWDKMYPCLAHQLSISLFYYLTMK